ncbi:uncharacterized protein LOC119083264 [Bradysia coprophila]|uniref:uncharacterized protein LOC119083264 n=1 Tax=Bradysia coprophila TaxID=38358 RepID=UPI00187DD1DD|nr:uncharacterized protein LOC119083264 [Bradysia coprophila]
MNFLFGRSDEKINEKKDGPIYYHYTSGSAAHSISRDGRIRSGRDGVLLTTMAPEHHFRQEILYNNYGGNVPANLRNRADYCVRVLPSKMKDKKLHKIQYDSRRLIYVYDDDIRVSRCDVFDKPKCTKHEATNTGSLQQSSSTSAPKPVRSSVATNAESEVEASPTKSRPINEIRVQLRCDLNLSQCQANEYQDESVTIFAFDWVEEGLKLIGNILDDETLVNVADSKKYYMKKIDFDLKDLQIVSRNESSNTSGLIDFRNYSGISHELIYSLKDLNRQTVIIGKDLVTNPGRYPQTESQSESVYICDLIGLQFQQKYNTGRLVLVGEDLPRGVLDDFIYTRVVQQEKPTIDNVRSDCSGRFIECSGVYFDSTAYVKFVAHDVLLAGIALNQSATEPLNFKFLKYGTGFYAGPFRHLLDRFIGQGVAEGLENLLKNLPENHRIRGIELPYFDRNAAIDVACSQHNLELRYGKEDALKSTLAECITATTNSADSHSMTGNKMGFGSVDGAIAENLSGKAIKFSPIINGLMQKRFV